MDGITIEGKLGRKTSNALDLPIMQGAGDPIATGRQSGGETKKGGKLAILFGFRNGGTGTHSLTFADGEVLHVQSRDAAPTLVTRPDGVEVAVIERGDTSIARSGGRTVLTFAPDPDEPKSVELFRMLVSDGSGAPLGRFDIIRTNAGWSIGRIYNTIEDLWVWWDRAGQGLKLPLLGVRMELSREPTAGERQLLCAAAVDITVGLRPYIAAMR